jgi:hypothetical protein
MNSIDLGIKKFEKINPKTSHSKNKNLSYVLEVTRTTLLIKAIGHWNVWKYVPTSYFLYCLVVLCSSILLKA